MSIHKKINKSISWSITKNCNYNCDYCISADRKFRKDKYPEPYSFLRGFKKYLKGSWIFYICGSGEPFLTPRFLDIIKELVKNTENKDNKKQQEKIKETLSDLKAEMVDMDTNMVEINSISFKDNPASAVKELQKETGEILAVLKEVKNDIIIIVCFG